MHKTQCPHCFTVYVISDEQLNASQGMVRCGTCRERFEAQLLDANGAPKIDLSHAFIEPLSEAEQSKLRVDDFIDESPSFSFKQMSDQSIDQYTAAFSANDFSLDDNVNSELSIEIDDDVAELMDPSEIEELEKVIQRELEIPASDLGKTPSSTAAVTASGATSQNINSSQLGSSQNLESEFDDSRERSLIDQVDALVEEKILSTHSEQSIGEIDADKLQTQALDKGLLEPQAVAQAALATSEQGDLFKPQASKWVLLRRGLGAITILIGVALLICALVYQLWLKQIVSWPDKPEVQERIAPIVEIAKQQMDTADVEIPARRNLSQLELVSARTEAHPSRPTTLLLRVSLINHAQISQPLPWLELSLTNADGRLVARRNFSPSDYIYNNRIDANIGARQLKRITVELLAFPKQATGYEVKLLNK